MKKLKVSLLILFIICLCNFTKVLATEESVKLNVDKTTLKPGDTVTATLNANCDEGLSFVGTKIEYDTNVLTLQSKTIANDWIDYGTDKLELFINSSNKTTNASICTLVFKVKENAVEGTTTISANEIEITDINNNEYTKPKSEKILTIAKEETQPETTTLTSIEIEGEPTKEYTEGEKVDLSDIKVIAKYSDGTSKEITDYTFAPNKELTKEDKNVVISYKEGDVTKTANIEITVAEKTPEGNDDNKGKNPAEGNNDKNNGENKPAEGKDNSTSEDGKYPNTGVITLALPIVAVIILAGASYVGYKKYKQI